MMRCPVSCGTCTKVCQDKDESCRAWAVDGECESNAAHMTTACPQSCGLCHSLEKHYSTLHGGEEKDEL